MAGPRGGGGASSQVLLTFTDLSVAARFPTGVLFGDLYQSELYFNAAPSERNYRHNLKKLSSLKACSECELKTLLPKTRTKHPMYAWV